MRRLAWEVIDSGDAFRIHGEIVALLRGMISRSFLVIMKYVALPVICSHIANILPRIIESGYVVLVRRKAV